ncbi:MAG: AMP-dependent synthetase [Rhodospirillales bacterium CG15_BIG_FIL_POST_REV_8_21_14_020_66_15]|nr:MAG: AMP-dependent synthetase [Rhodospirillales bacterium CG15_BIG_FIL_POST_REV_8_21_14_020_66_15]
MLTRTDSYDELYNSFAWDIPARFNMGVDVCDKHAARNPEAPALIVTSADGDLVTYSFGAIRALSNQAANLFTAHGLAPGDRISVLLPQSVEAALTHVAAWKAGLISVPLFTLFGEDALKFRLADSGSAAVVTDLANHRKIAALADALPGLKRVYVIDAGGNGEGFTDFWGAMGRASDAFTPVATAADDPGLIVYTSGTTGNPKGALHAHRTLLGHLPAAEMFHNFLGRPGDLMWTPADWAWIGGLMNTLMCAWHHGVPVVAYRARKYDPEEALALMARLGVRNTFMPPTALRLMSKIPDIRTRHDLKLRSVASAGEAVGAELFRWGHEALGLAINEFYGQTECNIVVSNCAEIMEVRPGSMGRPAPGHVVDIIDADGNILPPGREGDIACRAPDPVMLLEYWNNPEATKANMRGDWWLMGDTGYRDEEGYLWFVGRGDDVITSAGYRIGPGEIEDCLSHHPAVQLAAVVGVPDPVRTEAVKAFVVLAPGHNGGAETEQAIRDFVKTRLSSHEYPRMIEFVDELPMTATGKIKRKELRDAEIAKQRDA